MSGGGSPSVRTPPRIVPTLPAYFFSCRGFSASATSRIGSGRPTGGASGGTLVSTAAELVAVEAELVAAAGDELDGTGFGVGAPLSHPASRANATTAVLRSFIRGSPP